MINIAKYEDVLGGDTVRYTFSKQIKKELDAVMKEIGENIDGLAKGKAIASRLGYSKDNYKEFDNLLKGNISKYPALSKGDTSHGRKYEVT